MTNVDRRRSYRPGGWFGIFGDNASVLLPPSEKHRVTALWELVDEGAGFDEVLDGLLATGLRDLPGFVLVSDAAGMTKVVLRGAAVAAFVVDGDMVELAGNTDTTWVERSLVGVSQMFVQVEATDEDEGEDLLIENGLVRLGRVDQPPFRLEEADDAVLAAAETGEPGAAEDAAGSVGDDASEDPDRGVDPLGLGAAAAATGLGAGFAGGRLLGDDDAPSAEPAPPEAEVGPESHEAGTEPEAELAEREPEDANAEQAEAASVDAESQGADEAGEPAAEPAHEASEAESPEDEEPAGAPGDETPSDEAETDGPGEPAEESSDEVAEPEADAIAGDETGDADDETSAEDAPVPPVSWASPPESESEPDSAPESDDESPAEATDEEVPADAPGPEENGAEEPGTNAAATDETPTEETPAEMSVEADEEPSPWAPPAASVEEPAEAVHDTMVDVPAADDAPPADEPLADQPSSAPSWGQAASNFGTAAPTYPPASPTDDPLSAPLPGAVAEADDHDGLTRGGREHDAEPPAASAGEEAPDSGPAVARLLFSSGDEIDVDRPVLVGRAPEVRRFGGHDQPRLVPVPSPHQEISATHLEVRPGVGADHGSAVVTDLGSTNGTVLVQPGLPPEDLQPGIAVQLMPGAIIDLGDGVTIQVARV